MTAEPAPEGSLRAVSFNIRNGVGLDGCSIWPFRRTATAAALADLAPDIACLQEVYGFQLRWLRRHLPGFSAAGDPRRDGRWRGERCPVLARRERLSIRSASTRWFGDVPDQPGTRLPGASFPRLATLVVVEDSLTGRSFGVAGTHFDASRAENRVAAARQLVSWLDPALPWIVAGDLNDRPGSETLAVLQGAGFTSALPDDAGGTDHGFTGRTDGPRIDHILVTRHWRVERGWVSTERPGGRLPSDHWPVAADLVLEG